MHKKQPSDSEASISVFYREKSLETLFYITVLFIFSIYLLCVILLHYNKLLISIQK